MSACGQFTDKKLQGTSFCGLSALRLDVAVGALKTYIYYTFLVSGMVERGSAATSVHDGCSQCGKRQLPSKPSHHNTLSLLLLLM